MQIHGSLISNQTKCTHTAALRCLPETCNLRENGIEMAIKNPNGHQVALNLYACLRLLWGLGPPHTFPERSESKAHRGFLECENYNELRVQNHAKTSYADSISVESHK